MPSGAKKRKATKKKLHDTKSHHHNHSNNSNSSSTFHSQEIDGGDLERESSGETAVKSYDGESMFTGTAKEVSQERKSSSGSSSSDDDNADVEKDKSVVGEVGNERVKSDDLGSGENGVGAEVVEENVDESIPVEETVKEVVLSNPLNDSVLVENSSVPDAVDSELKPTLNEVSSPSGEKENVEKVEGKEIPVVDNGSENSSISTDKTARYVESKSGGDDHVKKPEKVKNSEEQPLRSSAPLPVRRTSWMNCCGLFEVISGGSGR